MDLSMFRRRIVPRRELLFWTSLIVFVVAIKIIFLLFDRLPIFYLGDSGVYLSSAISDSRPNDRSFTYGLFFIRPVLAIFGSLGAVVVFQALVSGATGILAGVCMRVGFDAPLWVVAVTVVSYAFEPLALIHERLILTETVALFFFAAFVLVGLFYIRQPRWYLLLLLAPLGTITLSLRTSFVPVILIATASVVLLGVPRLWELATDRRNFLRVLFLHTLVAVVATAGFHEAYKQYFSYMTNARPSYNAGGGFFLIASWAPLITRADFPNERVADRILSNVKHDLGKRSARPVHRFWRDGLVGAIIKAENGNGYLAQKLAGKIAKKAALRDPLGVARLAWETYGDFWDDRIMNWRLKSEEGTKEIPKALIKHFNEHYNEDLSAHHLETTVTKEWHRSNTYWYRFLLLSPLLSLLTIVIAGPYRASSTFVAILVCGLIVVNCALVTEAVFRYLQPVAWLVCLQLGQILSRYAQALGAPDVGGGAKASTSGGRVAPQWLSPRIFDLQELPEQRRLVVWLTLLVAFAAGLRLYALDRWSLWLDETITYLYASKPLGKLYGEMDATHMPVSLEFSHALIQLGFDQNVWQLRLPSAILGVATVVGVFFLANELFCKRVALFSALVACVMPVLVVYSQEYRPYSLLIFLTVLSGWSLASALRTNGPGWWCLFVGATILNLYTHFVALSSLAALIVAALACILLRLQQREPIKPTIASSMMAFGVIAVAYLPAVARLERVSQISAQNWGGDGPGWEIFRLVYVQYPGFGGWLSYVAVGLAMLGLIWGGARSPRGLLFLASMLFVSAFLFRDHSRVAFSPRYVSFVMPYFAVAIGAGLAALTFAVEALAVRLRSDARQLGAMTAAVLLFSILFASARPLSMVYAANPKQIPIDLREGFDSVLNRIQPGDLLLKASTEKGGSVYWFKAYDSYFLREGSWPGSANQGMIDNVTFPNQYTGYVRMRGRLWVLMTVGDTEQASVEKRAGEAFDVQCFRRICAIQSRKPDRPMLEQLNAFFDRFADLDPKYFAAPARAVRAKIN